MSETYWVILICANLPLYIGWGWLVFDDLDGFLTSVKFWIKPDILSWFDGELWEDRWAEFKLFGWIVCCALSVGGEHWALQKWVF